MESGTTLIDFSRICRLCMTEEPSMSSIFSDQVGAVPLPLRIMACVSVEVTQTDGLPSHICSTCLCQVDSWYKFKDLCESADSTLRKLILREPVPCEEITKIISTAEDVKRRIFTKEGEKYHTLEPYHSFTIPSEDPSIETVPQEQLKKPKSEVARQQSTSNTKNTLLEDEDCDSGNEEQLDIIKQEFSEDDLHNGHDQDDTLEFTGNGADGYSTDDSLPLLAQREKLLSEKRIAKRVKGRKKIKVSEMADVVSEKVISRTIQIQTSFDDSDATALEIHEGEIVAVLSDKSQKKKRNKGTQTSRAAPTAKKRFRVRPAIPSACNLCDKVYKNSEILRQHMKSHHVSGTIECPQCQITFTSLRSLKYHEQRKHSDIEPLPCSFCGKKFLDKKYLRIHENIHSQANQYVCQFCGRKFIMKTNLTVHISRHHTQKTNDFICQVCGKAFPFKLYLKKHFKTHTDYKPHACSYCDARFRESTLLRKHINCIHLKLRPFLCQYCHKTFTRGLYLREHMESQHLGIPRKVECPRCGETFHNRSRLRQHDCTGRLEVLQ